MTGGKGEIVKLETESKSVPSTSQPPHPAGRTATAEQRGERARMAVVIILANIFSTRRGKSAKVVCCQNAKTSPKSDDAT